MSSSLRPSEDAATENTPLLVEEQEPASPEDDVFGGQSERAAKLRAKKVLILIGISIVAADFGSYLSFAPQIDILEKTLCKRLHGREPPSTPFEQWSEPDCKADDVQTELALVVGWMAFFNTIPGIVLALPYGLAADRIGRKPVLLLSLVGLILEEVTVRVILWRDDIIATKAIWAAPLFQLIGGGPQVASSMAFTIITDVFPASQRSSIFFVLSAIILLGELLATPISAFAMAWTPWFPFLAALAFELTGLVVALAVSETMPERCPQEEHVDAQCVDDAQSPETRRNWTRRTMKKLSDLSQRRQEFRTLGSVLAVIGAFVLASIGRDSLQFVIQYASKKFSWSIAQSSLLITIKGLIHLLSNLFLLPQLSRLLQKHKSAARSDLLLVKGSVCLLAVGTALMACAQHPALFAVGISLFALGWGYYAALRSLAMSLVLPSQAGALNTAIAMGQSFGAMTSGPILAFSFRLGVAKGGVWLGLPYMSASLLFLFAAALILGIRLTRPDDK